MSKRDEAKPHFSGELTAGDPAELGLSVPGLQRLSDVLRKEIGTRTMPGAVAIIGRRGRIGYFEAFGVGDPANGAAMPRDAVFRIYSMTKPVTSVAAMMLVEEGLLLLDAALSAYIPAFADVQVAHVEGGKMTLRPPARPITVQDLMRHTAGLTHEIMGTGPVQTLYAEARMARRDQTNEEHAAAIARLPLICDPGTEWNYSRSVEVLGRVIEIVSGLSLGAFLEARILDPLGMTDTGFHIGAKRGVGRLAEPFPDQPWVGTPSFDMTEKPRFEAGGGGLVSTAGDYARFAQMLLNGGMFGDRRYLGSRTVAFMTADHLDAAVKRAEPLPHGYSFGLGFAVRTAVGRAPYPGSIGQLFWNGAAGTQFFIDPAEELWAILLVQAPGRRDRLKVLFRNLVYAAIE